jgi:autotransporter-associated beta strand protein
MISFRNPKKHLVRTILVAWFPLGANGDTTWDGGSTTNSDWSRDTNWSGDTKPTASTSESLTFDGSTRLDPNNNYSDWSDFKNILFASGAGSFTITGNAVDLYGKIENNSSVLQTVSLSQFSFNNGSAELDPTLGDLTINAQNIWTNGNTISVWGTKTLTINNTGGNGISQGGGLHIRSAATVVLTGSNNYTGATTIGGGGTLQLGNGGAGGGISSTSIVTFDTGSQNNTLRFQRSGNPTFANTIQTGTGSSHRANVSVASGTSATLSGAITATSGSDGGEFWKLGGGKLVITPNAGSSGRTVSNVIDAGTLSVSDFSTSTLGSGNFFIRDGILEYTGASTTTTRLAGYALQNSASEISVTQSGTTLTLSENLGGYSDGGLKKSGAGTLALTAANNTYVGPTVVSAGTLIVNGNLTGNGAVTVASGATFGGGGTINGNTTISGIHSPGDGGTGIQDFGGDLTYSGTSSIFAWELGINPDDTGTLVNGGSAYDKVHVTGNLLGTNGGDATFRILLGNYDFSTAFWTVSRSWDNIFTASNSFDLNSVFGGFSYANDSGSLDPSGYGLFSFSGSTLQWSAVPEPGSAAMAGCFLLSAVLIRRRRPPHRVGK